MYVCVCSIFLMVEKLFRKCNEHSLLCTFLWKALFYFPTFGTCEGAFLYHNFNIIFYEITHVLYFICSLSDFENCGNFLWKWVPISFSHIFFFKKILRYQMLSKDLNHAKKKILKCWTKNASAISRHWI